MWFRLLRELLVAGKEPPLDLPLLRKGGKEMGVVIEDFMECPHCSQELLPSINDTEKVTCPYCEGQFELGELQKAWDIEIENDLLEMYSTMFADLSNVSLSEAEKMVMQAINQCKLEAIEEGWDNASFNYGELIVRYGREGDKWCNSIVAKASEDGATNDDIIEWWNMHYLQRKMVIWSEYTFRMVVWSHLQEQGYNKDEIVQQIRVIFPFYLDSDNERNKNDENSYLCHEIRGRIDKYQASNNAEI